MTGPFRVLVTGSRSWDDYDHVRFALATAVFQRMPAVVVHGACPQGADAIAAWWVRQMGRNLGLTEEPHPADWAGPCRLDCDHGQRREDRQGRSFCPAAGEYRNALMVGLGADLCLAFIDECRKPRCRRPRPHGSHGAEDCAGQAEAAGIRTVPYRPWRRDEQLALIREDLGS
jgi:hypothetical protein